MLRPLHRFLAIFLSVFLAWWGTYQGWFDKQIAQYLGPVVFSTVRGQVSLFPLYAVVALGFYGIFSIGFALMTFTDCPEKAEELKEDIKEAKAYLAKKGFKMDSKQR